MGYKVFIFDIAEEELELEHCVRIHLKQYYDQQRVGSAICNLRSVDEIRSKLFELGYPMESEE